MEAVYSTPFLDFHFSKHHHALAIKTAPLVMKTERKINTDKTLRSQDAFKHPQILGDPQVYYPYLFSSMAENPLILLPVEMYCF